MAVPPLRTLPGRGYQSARIIVHRSATRIQTRPKPTVLDHYPVTECCQLNVADHHYWVGICISDDIVSRCGLACNGHCAGHVYHCGVTSRTDHSSELDFVVDLCQAQDWKSADCLR